MKINDLIDYLSNHDENTPIKIQIDGKVIDFTGENIMLTSETAFVDETAPVEDWNEEGGKIELGDGQRYILFNPIIV